MLKTDENVNIFIEISFCLRKLGYFSLRSVVGLVIQATGRTEVEGGLRLGRPGAHLFQMELR